MNQLIEDIAEAYLALDTSGVSFREFKAGVGPYGEPQLVRHITNFLNEHAKYRDRVVSKRTPDLLIAGSWAVEFKIARPFGDNGLEAENWSVNLLHPFPGNTSVFGDGLKLHAWAGHERRTAVVIGFEHDPPMISLDPLFCTFEAVAERLLPFRLFPRVEVRRGGLRHPVHQVLRVAAWEVPTSKA